MLVDSERLSIRVESRLLTDLGWPLSEADVVERFVGRSDSYMLAEIEEHLGRAVPEWQGLYENALHESFHAELTAVDGIADALDRITAATCVASSGTHEKMDLTLGLTGLRDRFEGRIFSATQVANGKPAPDLFLFAASRMGVEPDRCVVVEDSPSGVRAARAAGMRCVAYAGGVVTADRLDGLASVVIDDMADLHDAIASVASTPLPG